MIILSHRFASLSCSLLMKLVNSETAGALVPAIALAAVPRSPSPQKASQSLTEALSHTLPLAGAPFGHDLAGVLQQSSPGQANGMYFLLFTNGSHAISFLPLHMHF